MARAAEHRKAAAGFGAVPLPGFECLAAALTRTRVPCETMDVRRPAV